jgi:hypothetical protein
LHVSALATFVQFSKVKDLTIYFHLLLEKNLKTIGKWYFIGYTYGTIGILETETYKNGLLH